MYRYIKRVSDSAVFTYTDELDKQFPAFVEITEAERDELLDAQARKKERLLKVMPPPPEPAPSKLVQTPPKKLDHPPLPKGDPEKTVTVLQPHNMEMATGIGFGTPALTPVPEEEDDEPVGETYPVEMEDGTVEAAPEPKRKGNPHWIGKKKG